MEKKATDRLSSPSLILSSKVIVKYQIFGVNLSPAVQLCKNIAGKSRHVRVCLSA